MKVETTLFGHTHNDREVKLFSFKSEKGLYICITNFGGIITSIKTPNRQGTIEEVVAGFDTLDEYLKGHPHFGVIVGRFANRIAKGKFTIDKKEYNLPINNSPNHLHGGNNGFHNQLWDYQLETNNNHAKLSLTYHSPNLQEGYPGNLTTKVVYTVYDNNSFDIDFFANTDAPTHVNLTSHSYFNLNGFKDNIFSHKLTLNANKYLEIDGTQIPTGNLVDCELTPFDFSEPKTIGPNLNKINGGIDHCYVLNPMNSISTPAATLEHNESGRKLTVYCSHPGLQVYTGNSLDGSLSGHNGTVYKKHMGICLEMQHFPDTPNKPHFPSTLLKPGELYQQKARFVFETI